MSTYAEFTRRLAKLLAETVEEKTEHMASGAGIPDYASYRERVGELRAYADLRRMIEEAQKQTEERTSK